MGISKAEFLEPEARRLESWLNNGYQGNMSFMEDYFDLRVDPSKLVPGAKSVISLLFNYAPEEPLETDNNYKIARYAYGKDYHRFLKKRVARVMRDLKEKVGDFQSRIFVDAAPIMERDLAKRAGLGWIGKNTLLINKEKGSYFLLAELIVDLEFEYNNPISDFCGTCTKCVDACPTDAISPEGFSLDASKCISYLTIELKEAIPEEFKGKMADWVFGCDICQEVCPWNRFSTPNNERRFIPKEELKALRKPQWEEMTAEVFEDIFIGTAFKRPQYKNVMRNVAFAKIEKLD